MSNEKNFDGTKPSGLVNRINDSYLDSVLDGIKSHVKTTITGNPSWVMEGEDFKRDANGKKIPVMVSVTVDGVTKTMQKRDFEPVDVEYTIDWTGSLFRSVLKRAVNDVTVQIGKTGKDAGLSYINEKLNGSTQIVSDILLRKGSPGDAGMFKLKQKLIAMPKADREKYLKELMGLD